MTTDNKIFNFDEVPPATRTGGVGGGRPAGELLQRVRSLEEGQATYVEIPEDTKDVNKFAAQISSSLGKKGVLDFKVTIRRNLDRRRVEIYRRKGSRFAVNADGTPVLNDRGHRVAEYELEG